ERVEFACDLRQVAPGLARERGHAPVGDRQHQDPVRASAGEPDRTFEQFAELLAVLLQRSAPVLVVDADEQAHQRERPLRRGRVDAGRQLVGGPAGGGDDLRIVERAPVRAQCARQQHRPAAVRIDALADGVAVAQRQETPGPARGAAHAAGRAFFFSGTTLVRACARRSSTRSMRANTSRTTSGCGSRVSRKWLRYGTLKLLPGTISTCSVSSSSSAKAWSSKPSAASP